MIDSFDFVLAEALGKHLWEIRALPSYEVEEWRAFHKVRETLREHASKGE